MYMSSSHTELVTGRWRASIPSPMRYSSYITKVNQLSSSARKSLLRPGSASVALIMAAVMAPQSSSHLGWVSGFRRMLYPVAS